MAKYLLVFYLGVLLLIQGCESTGSGTVTTNNISGRVVDEKNNPLAGASITLRKTNYLASVNDLVNPQDSSSNNPILNAVSDKNGNFNLKEIVPGNYTLEFNLRDSLAGLAKVNVDSSSQPIQLSNVQAKQMAQLHGYLPLPKGVNKAWVMVYGLERRVEVNPNTGAYTVKLPAGQFTLRSFYLDMQVPRTEIQNILVNAGETKQVNPYQAWSTKRIIRINTSATGAGITQNVLDFPLLVRLNSSNFDFSKAQPQGQDVRFSKASGKPLFYEIERWDSQNQEAEVWVLVDTILGNSNSQVLTMYSGNSNAQDESSGPQVFGSSGFTGVWHLNQNALSTGTTNLYSNSVNSFHFGNDFVKSTLKEGSIGLGQTFEREDFIQIENVSTALKPDTAFSISVWLKADSVDSGFFATPEDPKLKPYYEKGSEVLSMGNDFGIRIMGSGKIRFFIFDETQRPPTPDSLLYIIHTVDSSYLDNKWHQVVSTFSNSTMSLYIDGKLDSSKSLEFNRITYDGSPHFFIGRHGNQEPSFDFMGSLDEVRINKRKNSAAWIRLAYLNQLPQSSVVTLEYKEAD